VAVVVVDGERPQLHDHERLAGWLCQPVDEWGPNVYWPTIVFVPGCTARPMPVGIDPVAMTDP
jgi:hypothetical protein